MNRKINLLTFALAVVALLPLCSFASDLKPLYSARAKTIGVSGDTEALTAADSLGRFVLNPIQINCEVPVPADGKKFTPAQVREVENCLNGAGAAREVLKYMYDCDGKNVDDKLLLERAAANRKLCGLPPVSDTELRESFLPLLMHNYIYLERMVPVERKSTAPAEMPTIYYRAYMLFKVTAAPELWTRLRDMPTAAMLNDMDVRVEYVRGGAIGHHTEILRELERHVADFRYTGAIVGTEPLTASFGSASGLKNGSLAAIYREETGPDGLTASRRIGYARVGVTGDDSSKLYPLNYTLRDAAPGDMAVKEGNRRSAVQLEATWMKHLLGGALSYSYLCAQNGFGWNWRVIMEIGYSASDIGNRKIVNAKVDKRHFKRLRGPVQEYYGQIGAGFSKTFGGILEVMPQVMFGYAHVKTHTPGPDTGKSMVDNFNGHYFRIPVGVSVGLNSCYPVQFVLSLGYTSLIGFEFKGAQASNENHGIVRKACDMLGVGIDGLYLKLGARYNF